MLASNSSSSALLCVLSDSYTGGIDVTNIWLVE